jgi:outer membrane protein
VKKLAKVFGLLAVVSISFYSCNKSGSSSTAENGTESKSQLGGSDLKIAYILTDSVIANYDFFKKRSGEITEKGRKFETELGTRAKGFEQEVANFQQTATTMTMNQAKAKEEDLVKKERNLMTYRDNLMQELSADESKLYSDVYDQITVFLAEYAEEKELEFIFSYTRGGAIWYSKKAFDITDDVTEALNKKFTSSPTAAKDSIAK